ncbi:MAG: hypothetical protein U5Q03_02635 [Bacteroidota bacterium]|nr:hypothetical protein [Bacteroidota bacterium]
MLGGQPLDDHIDTVIENLETIFFCKLQSRGDILEENIVVVEDFGSNGIIDGELGIKWDNSVGGLYILVFREDSPEIMKG